MRNKLLGMGAVLFVIIAIGCWTGTVIADDSLKAPEDELVIEGKKPARFAHKVHLGLGLECGVCHHDREHKPLNADSIATLGDPSGLICISCHNSGHPDNKLQKAKDVFHARCQKCHKEGYEGKNGPTKCTGCHIKTKKKAVEGC